MKKSTLSIFVLSMFLNLLLSNTNSAKAISCLSNESETSFNLEQKEHFVENKGQVRGFDNQAHPEVKYSLKNGNTSVFILPNGIAYQFNKIHFPEGYKFPSTLMTDDEKEKMEAMSKQIQVETYRMDMELIGANQNATITAEGKSGDYINFYTTSTLDVHHYTKLIFHEIYPGIDWVIYAYEAGFKYDFVVKANANPSLIKMKFTNQEGLEITKDGSLIVSNRMGNITEQNPVSTQKGKLISTTFNKQKDIVSFNLGNYDKSQELTIDPAVVWATYYGGTGADAGRSTALDASGNVYLAGYTSSASAIAVGGYQLTYGGGAYDGFLVKFNSAGVRQWGTYYGGTNDDYVYGSATDPSGNIFICGYTKSTASIASGGHQNTHGGGTDDGFLVKFNSAGVRQWATYYGGSAADYGSACVADASGNIYLAGNTFSSSGIASGGFDVTIGATSRDAFLVKFNASGVRQWATYYGDIGEEYGNGCTTDATGNVYLSGSTASATTTAIGSGGHQNTFGGGQDAFLVKFNTSGARQWGTYFGGTSIETGNGCCTDASGNVYLAATTRSFGLGFSGFDMTMSTGGGDENAMLVKFTSAGVRTWATYYGMLSTQGIACSANSSGDIFLIGTTNATSGVAIYGAQNVYGGGSFDTYVVKFSPTCSRTWGTYYGGPSDDYGYSIKVGSTNEIYFSGNTTSFSSIASGGHQNTNAGSTDAFLTKFCDSPPIPGTITGSTTVCSGTTNTYTIAAVSGATSYTWTLPSGATGTSTTNTINVTFGTTSGNISVTANSSCGNSAPSSLAITVNTVPTAATSISGSVNVCPSSTNAYTALGATGATSYVWTVPAGWSGTSTTSSISAIAGTSGGTISVVANNTCGSSSTTTLSITVNSVPATPGTISGSTSICSGTTNVYSVATIAGATSYTWTLPAGWSGTSTTNSISATAGTSGGTISVVANNVCGSSGTATLAVTVNTAPPTPGAVSGNVNVCQASSQTYSVTAVAGATSYAWTLPSGWSGVSTTNSISTITNLTGGTVSVLAIGPCGISSASSLTVTVTALPMNGVTQSGPSLTSVQTGATYQWLDCNTGFSAISGATNQNYTATANGSYAVLVTLSGCSDTSSCYVVSTTGIESQTELNNFSVYPNPTEGSFKIQFDKIQKETVVEVVDIIGQVIYYAEISDKQELELHIEGAAGMYFLKVISEEKQLPVVRIIKK